MVLVVLEVVLVVLEVVLVVLGVVLVVPEVGGPPRGGPLHSVVDKGRPYPTSEP